MEPGDHFNPFVVRHPALTAEERSAVLGALMANYKPGDELRLSFSPGAILSIIAIVAFLGITVNVYGALLTEGPALGRLLLPVFALVLFVLFMGWRAFLKPAPASHKLLRGSRLPVLYLRRSHQDGSPTISRMRYHGNLSKLAEVEGGVEARVGQVFRKWGPVVGLPGGEPRDGDVLGIHRLGGEVWQLTVRALMKTSQATVFVVGPLSPYIRWELQHAAALVPAKRVVFVVPKGSDPADCAAFAQEAERWMRRPIALPEHPDETAFVAFVEGRYEPVAPLQHLPMVIPRYRHAGDQADALEADQQEHPGECRHAPADPIVVDGA